MSQDSTLVQGAENCVLLKRLTQWALFFPIYLTQTCSQLNLAWLDSAWLSSTKLNSARLSSIQQLDSAQLKSFYSIDLRNISQCVPEVYRGGSSNFVCLILEVLRAHLLDNKIDVFCVNNEKPKKEKVQFCSQGGGVHPPASLILGAKGIKMQHGTVLFYSIN